MNRRSTRESSTAWTDYHRRTDAVRRTLEHLQRSPEPDLPWDEATAATFADRSELLTELHGVWTRRVLARVDAELETSDRPAQDVVVTAWQEVAASLPALRRLLDHHADDPAMARCEAAEHRMLAVAGGLATFSDPPSRSAALGRRLVASAAEQSSYAVQGRQGRLWLHPFRRTQPTAPTAA